MHFTATPWIWAPPTIPFYHYSNFISQRNIIRVIFHYSMLNGSGISKSLLWTLPFAHSKCSGLYNQPNQGQKYFPEWWPTNNSRQILLWRTARVWRVRNSTTSFLTAATLVYTIGAGITAAAGTRLALQLFLERTFAPNPFQLASS